MITEKLYRKVQPVYTASQITHPLRTYLRNRSHITYTEFRPGDWLLTDQWGYQIRVNDKDFKKYYEEAIQ